MLTTVLSALTLIASAMTAPVATIARAPHGAVVALRLDDRSPAAAHMDSARRALNSGDFDGARREYVIAAALDRDEGKLPVDATFGLASVLYARNFSREAAITMDKLATEASAAGDYDTEARALLDAIWLNIDSGQRAQARVDGLRLKALIKERTLSSSTRALIDQRFR